MTWRNHSVDALTEALRKLPAPEPPDGLLPRILASRTAGLRVVLPMERSAVTRRHTLLLAAAAAALTLLAAGVASVMLHSDRVTDDRVADAAAEWVFRPTEALAQEPGGRRYVGSYPPPDLDPSRFAPGRWVYQTRVTIDGYVTDTVTADTMTISPESYEGTPAWRITNRWGNRYFAARDTLIVAREGLRPLRRTWFQRRASRPGDAPPSWEYPGDSSAGPLLLVRVSRDYAGAVLPTYVRPALGLVDYSYLKPTLGLLRPAPGMRGSVYVRWGGRLAPSDPIPFDVTVAGREAITVPAGRFDCWKVDLQVPSNKLKTTAWISVDSGWVIRLRDPQRDGFTEQVLVSATPPGP